MLNQKVSFLSNKNDEKLYLNNLEIENIFDRSDFEKIEKMVQAEQKNIEVTIEKIERVIEHKNTVVANESFQKNEEERKKPDKEPQISKLLDELQKLNQERTKCEETANIEKEKLLKLKADLNNKEKLDLKLKNDLEFKGIRDSILILSLLLVLISIYYFI